MISLGAELISEFGETYQVRRTQMGQYIEGVFQPGITELVTALASIQPMSMKEIMRIAEGDRNRERRVVYSADELRIQNEENKAPADVMLVDGQDWTVEKVEKWPNFWKAIIVTSNTDETPE